VGLPLALQAHRDGNLEVAEQHYKRALEQQVRDPILFQNYGALLRGQGRVDTAAAIYEQGTRLFPAHAGILANQANLLAAKSPASALALTLAAVRLQLAQGVPPEKLRGALISAIAKLRELQLCHWALALVQEALLRLGPDPHLLLQMLLLLELRAEQSEPALAIPGNTGKVVRLIEQQLEQCDPLEQAEIRLGLASHRLGQADVEGALANYERGMAVLRSPESVSLEERVKRQKLVDINSWNFGCTLLKHQDLQRGWQLFEYGLRTPAEGKQRWQRALRKPFSASDLPLWRGESLAGQRLLLLEEQAIGDVMMFLTLVPTLLQEAESIGLLLGDRLLSIYRRSLEALGLGKRLQIWGYADAQQGKLSPASFTLQCPIGSICQHRFTAAEAYGLHLPLLKAKSTRVEQFRADYRSHGPPVERLIGISWRGGGKGARIKQKSITPEQFAQLLQPIPGVRFVSLQYGNAVPAVEEWRKQGLDVIHDPRVDPLKQMDLWLAQVAACDAVLSVANTTIHGAGGLGLPTQCLLSIHSDWRWFDDPAVTRSYGYPSVGILREHRQRAWDDAMLQARTWLEQGCPMPVGPVCTAPAP
jgi:tetratricopeptide (TPR) repeat protein